MIRGGHITKANADTSSWHKIWNTLLEAEKPLTSRELADSCGLTMMKLKSALTSMSNHSIPVYEEKAGNQVYYGAARALSHEKIDELIRVPEVV